MRKRRKFEYYKRDYSNPFFNRRDSVYAVYGSPWKTRAAVLAVLAAVSAGVWFVFYSSFFMIKSITAQGLERTSPSEIEQKAWSQADEKRFYIFSQKNIFIFDKNAFLDKLQNDYYFESVAIKKTFRRDLEINIKEKSPTAVWQENGGYYLIDQSGKVISQISEGQVDRNALPLIENRGEVFMSGRKTDISEENIAVITRLFLELKDKKDMGIDRFFIDKDIDTVKCILAGGPQVFFNTKNDFAKQVAKLEAVFKDDLKSEFKDKEYIDLRYGDMIYYK